MTAQSWIRAGGYLSGIGGLACTLAGRRAGGDARSWLFTAGAILLGGMFLCFLLSYALMVGATLRRPRRPPGFGGTTRDPGGNDAQNGG